MARRIFLLAGLVALVDSVCNSELLGEIIGLATDPNQPKCKKGCGLADKNWTLPEESAYLADEYPCICPDPKFTTRAQSTLNVLKAVAGQLSPLYLGIDSSLTGASWVGVYKKDLNGTCDDPKTQMPYHYNFLNSPVRGVFAGFELGKVNFFCCTQDCKCSDPIGTSETGSYIASTSESSSSDVVPLLATAGVLVAIAIPASLYAIKARRHRRNQEQHLELHTALDDFRVSHAAL